MISRTSSLSASSDPRILALVQIDRKLLDLARDVRNLRISLEQESRDRGVLGSRGLTQFVLEYLQSHASYSFTSYQLVQAAQQAGFSAPNSVTLTKRLSEHRRRTGKISIRDHKYWYWTPGQEEEE